MSLIPTYPALLAYECAFNVGPTGTALPPYWSDITARTTFAWSTARGRQYELDTNPAGQWNTALDNRDGALDPSNTSSPYYPDVIPYRPCRIRARLGVNALTVDQATAGQGIGLPSGLSGQNLSALLGVSNDFGYTVSLAASGSAYTGSQVYQVTLPAGSAANTTILLLSPAPVVPGQWYSATAQVRIPSGSTATCNTAIFYYTSAGAQVSATGGTAASITAGSSTWTTLAASAQAPAGASAAYYATIKVEITASVGSNTAVQVGALQWEQSATATPWQSPQTVPANLLPQVIATGSQAMNPAADSVFNWWWVQAPNASNSLAQATFLTTAPTGQATALAWQSPVGTNSATILYAGNWLGLGTAGPQPDNVQVTAGLQYTASWYTSRASSADSTVGVQGFLRWYNAAGASISTSHGSTATVPVAPSWSSRVAVTATAPAGAVWARIGEQIMAPTTTTAVNTIYHSGYQMEQNSAATTWMDPGPTGYIFTGFYERFPQTWLMSGTYGQVSAIGVDAEAVIAQDTLLAPFVEEILAINPNFFYQLNDPAGSSGCVDSAANRPAAPIENAPAGPGSLTLGSSITSTIASGGFVGTAGPVATFANTVSGPGVQRAETFVNIAKTTVAPGPPTSGSWTRMISFRSTTVPATGTEMNLWTAYPPSWNSGNLSSWWMQVYPGGFANMNIANSSNVGLSWTGTTNLCDGNWHQLATVVDATLGQLRFYVDGAPAYGIGSGVAYPTGIVADAIGCSITTGTNSYCQGFVGDIACALELPTATSDAQVAALYNSWRNASAGESSGARAQRVLNWIGYTGAMAIDAGSTSNMGPASDLTGATGLDALNAIALTENGNLYVSSSGALTFTARSRRYNQTVPVCILGENVAGGEWPYESASMDYDPTHLFNDIQVTQYSTSQVAESIDATSEASYLQRVLERTTNQGSFTETVDAANYLLQQYKSPRMRISDVTLHPAAVPGLWAVCMALEIGTRIRIMRRPPSAPAIAVDCFVESITWDVDPDTGDALVHLQCSPADRSAYWTLASLHTTLNAQAASGQNQATINALPDAAVNPLGASLSQNTGYQLVFDPGTAIQETMTLATNGVPSTGVGYTTAILTFASNFAFTHAAGATVCEVLPTAVTNPAAYDLASVLAPLSTTLNAAATSGTNTITVNALPDAKTNPASANWTTGDLIWISPGTAAWEGYNLLTPNQSTAGESALPLAAGTAGAGVGVLADAGPLSVTASATAWQGGNVWQSSITASVVSGTRLLRLTLAATPLQVYAASFYVRSVTSGANPQVAAQIIFQNASGTTLTTSTGTSVTLTGSTTASWTRVTVTATAPAGAVWLQAGVPLSATGPSSTWGFQADGLQVEPNASASAYQTCPQIASVGASVAGYSTVTLTLANNLANNHPAADYVCDPLPGGNTSPTQVAGTTRVTY